VLFFSCEPDHLICRSLGFVARIDTRRVAWRRVMDINDRALREIVCSLKTWEAAGYGKFPTAEVIGLDAEVSDRRVVLNSCDNLGMGV
jgi:Formate--tetrahydrofolate ligase